MLPLSRTFVAVALLAAAGCSLQPFRTQPPASTRPAPKSGSGPVISEPPTVSSTLPSEPSIQGPALVGLVRSTNPRSDVDWVMRAIEPQPGPQGLPLFKPPSGQLVAIDMNDGEIEWSTPNGDGPRDHPAHEP